MPHSNNVPAYLIANVEKDGSLSLFILSHHPHPSYSRTVSIPNNGSRFDRMDRIRDAIEDLLKSIHRNAVELDSLNMRDIVRFCGPVDIQRIFPAGAVILEGNALSAA